MNNSSFGKIFLTSVLGAVLAWSGTLAQAQSWPNRPIKAVVAYPPGTPGDVTLRLIAERVGSALGQPLIIENKPGAAGNIGAESVASATADGYTLLESPDATFTINPLVYQKLNFKPESIVPLTTLVIFSQMLVCHPSVPVRSVADLRNHLKSNQLSYASGGIGSPGHLVMEMFLSASGSTMNHVPYKGPVPAAQDLLSGQVACAFLVTNAVAPHVKAGRLVGLAMSGRKRSNLVPEVPTMQEAGLANFEATFAEMLYVPRGVPSEIMNRLQGEISKALQLPNVRERLAGIDVEPVGSTSEEAARRIRVESERWAPVVRQLNLRLE
jgi:tripartite-type tricarboxylate transporter receptor subunit TctC